MSDYTVQNLLLPAVGIAMLTGLAVGAAAMYFALDIYRGGRDGV